MLVRQLPGEVSLLGGFWTQRTDSGGGTDGWRPLTPPCSTVFIRNFELGML